MKSFFRPLKHPFLILCKSSQRFVVLLAVDKETSGSEIRTSPVRKYEVIRVLVQSISLSFLYRSGPELKNNSAFLSNVDNSSKD